MQLFAPIQGIVIPLERVPDPVFAQKIVGDGVAIDPTSNLVLAPCDGEILHLHPSRHAITIRTSDGVEIIIHVGLDTVNLKGEGFRARVKAGDRITLRQPLIEFDPDVVASKAKSLITLLIVSDSKGKKVHVVPQDRVQAGKDLMIEIAQNGAPETSSAYGTGTEIRKQVRVSFATGLHARPAAQLAQLAKSFQSNVTLRKGDRKANAKSVVNVMALEADFGDQLELLVNGSDASVASEALSKFFGSGKSTVKSRLTPVMSTRSKDPRLLRGIAVSGGVVLGHVHHLRPVELNIPDRSSGNPREELQKLEGAIIEAQEELSQLGQATREKGLSSESQIFESHREILDDPALRDKAKQLINGGESAPLAWNKTIQSEAQQMSELKNDLLAQRAVDLRDVGFRVLKVLIPDLAHDRKWPADAIVISDTITPSEVASFDIKKVLGFASVTGNATSHTAILARSLGIPAILAAAPEVTDLQEGLEILMDAEAGVLNVKPTKEEIDLAEKRQNEIVEREANAMKHAQEPARTPDGRRIEVHANISGVEDARHAVARGAEGIGLLRTEFLFLDKAEPPSEDEQLKVYQEISNLLADRPLTIRTLDVGGDKPPSFLELPKEENPFLGLRGIRVSFLFPQLFRTQIRALLRVKAKGPLNIMFPMISTLEEFHQAKKIVQEEMQTHPNPNVHLGVMVEVPSVALTADAFAREVEFFSIGTNDLTQYTLAMDRGNPNLNVDPLHPSLFSLIQMTVEAAHRNGRWVGVCGDLASQPKAIARLAAIGVDELSVAPPAVPHVKAKIRERIQS